MKITYEFLKTLDNEQLIDTLREYHSRKLIVTPELKVVINKASAFCSGDSLRPVMHNVLIDVPSNGFKCTVVATNAHVMYKNEYNLGYVKEQGKYLINPNMLKKYKSNVFIYVLEVDTEHEVKEAHFYIANDCRSDFMCSFPTGREYPDYNAVIPTNYTSKLRMDADYIHGACRSLEALKYIDVYFSSVFGVDFFMNFDKDCLELVPELDNTAGFENSMKLQFSCDNLNNGYIDNGYEGTKRMFKLNISLFITAVKALKEKNSRLDIHYSDVSTDRKVVILQVREGEQVLLMPIIDEL